MSPVTRNEIDLVLKVSFLLTFLLANSLFLAGGLCLPLAPGVATALLQAGVSAALLSVPYALAFGLFRLYCWFRAR